MRPRLLVSAGPDLFASFFPPAHEARLDSLFTWERIGTRTTDMAFTRKLPTADGLVTTWDSPHFGEDLLQIAPKLRMIAHWEAR